MAGEVLLVFVFIIGVLELFAVISNVFVILSVMFYKKLRTVTNVLISNLAVSDLLLGGLYMPKKLHDITHAADYFDGKFGEFIFSLLNHLSSAKVLNISKLKKLTATGLKCFDIYKNGVHSLEPM